MQLLPEIFSKHIVRVAMAQPEASAVVSSTADAEAPTPAPLAAPQTINTYRNDAVHSATTAFHNERVRNSNLAGTLPAKSSLLPEAFASLRIHSNFSNRVTMCCSKFSSDILNDSPILKQYKSHAHFILMSNSSLLNPETLYFKSKCSEIHAIIRFEYDKVQ